MKIIYLPIFVFTLFSFPSFAQGDSTTVEVCTHSSADCFGFDNFEKVVTYYSDGLKIKESTYIFSKCQGVIDSAIRHIFDRVYTYDSLNRNLSSTFYWFNFPDTFINVTTNNYYDVIRLTVSLLKQGTAGGQMTNTTLDSIFSDSLNNIIGQNHYMWSTNNNQWDPSIYKTYTYNAYNKNSTYLYNDLTNGIHTNYYFVYDADTNLITRTICDYSSTTYDSTKTEYTFVPVHRIMEVVFQNWDTLLLSWNKISRISYQYDSLNYLLVAQYSFDCPDSTCTDSTDKIFFTYDSFLRPTGSNSFHKYGGVLIPSGSSSIHYGINGLPVYNYEYDPDGSSCGGSSTHLYSTYNSNNRLTHVFRKRYTCDYYFDECDYYTLDFDSMLVQLDNFISYCQGDTMRPIVTVEGGTPPYTFQWTPVADLIDPFIEVPHIIVDSTENYLLTIFDSLGNMQSDTLTLTVNCFTTSITSIQTDDWFISPNPFHEKMIIKNPSSEKYTLSLFDINGKLISSEEIDEMNYVYYSNGLTPGVYILKFQTGQNILVRKVLAE